MKDYYKILELEFDASLEQIKRQRRFLLHAFHSDKFPSPDHKESADNKVKEINEAYSVLSNTEERRKYDAEWINHFEKGAGASPIRPTPPKPEVIPKTLDFGKLYKGQTKTKTFRVYNRGGDPKYKPKFVFDEDIFSLGMQHIDSFPLIIDVTVDTTHLEIGQKYEEWIDVILDTTDDEAITELTVVIEQVIKQPEIIGFWSPAEAAKADYFHNLIPGGKKRAHFIVKPQSPDLPPFKVRIAYPLPDWLRVEPMFFIPPAELTVEVTAPDRLKIGEIWAPQVKVELILDE